MKKLIVLFLIICLSAVLSFQIQAAEYYSPFSTTPTQDSGQAALRILLLGDKYYVYSVADKLVLKNGFLCVQTRDTLNFISPRVPENLWTRVYWDKAYKLGQKDSTWLEFNWLPVFKVKTVLHLAVLSDNQILYQDKLIDAEKKRIGFTWFTALIFFLMGLVIEAVLIFLTAISTDKKFPTLSLLIVSPLLICLSFIALVQFNWAAVIFTAVMILIGELSAFLMLLVWLKKRKKKLVTV